MPTDPKAKQRSDRQPPEKPKYYRKGEQEVLREQSKTETEERPYLDTEGGE